MITDFEKFIESLKQRLAKKLPGEDAQFKMAPVGRRMASENMRLNNSAAKKSAVLICLYPKHESLYLVLMKRPSEIGFHSNQISFPGGSFIPEDVSLENTALREANEEIGIDCSQINVLGELTPLYIPVSNFFVQPYLSYTNSPPSFTINHEVESLVEVDVRSLFSNEAKVEQEFNTGLHSKILAPAYSIHSFFVWGATAMILSELEELLLGTTLENSI